MRNLLTVLVLSAMSAAAVSASRVQAAEWVARTPAPAPLVTHSVVSVGTSLYSIGGATSFACCNVFAAPTYAYDTLTDTWAQRATMNQRRKNLAVVELDGIVYAIGGDNDFVHFTTNEAYDPATNSWSTRAPMPTPRAFPMAAAVDGILYVIGGENALGPRTSVEAYDPVSNSWSTKAPMLTAHSRQPVFAVVGKTIYVGGGMDATGAIIATMEAYDTTTNTWSYKSPLPAPRNGIASAAVGGSIYGIGGHSGMALSSILVYDVAADSWSSGPSLPASRFSASAAQVGGTIYAVGGFEGSPVTIVAKVEALTVGTPEPQEPPTLSVPGALAAEATGAGGAVVTYQATAEGSSGPVPVTCSPASGSLFPLGTTTVTCSAAENGQTAAAEFDVTVVDTTPPAVTSIAATPSRITARNHKMVEVAIRVAAADLVDGALSPRIAMVGMSDSPYGDGGNRHDPDWHVTGPLTLLVRAERPANMERTYTIVVEVVDDSGNRATATVTVTVGK